MKSAANVLKVMTDVNISFIPDEETEGSSKDIVPNVEPIGMEGKPTSIERLLKIDHNPINNVQQRSPGITKPLYTISRSDSDSIKVNGISLALCEMDRNDINALANPRAKEIFININSIVIQKIIAQDYKVQRVLLMEEISHELAHILGYGLIVHDTPFFKVQRILKYIAIQAM